METKASIRAISLWTLAVVLGVATMSLAILAAWAAHRGAMALPHWAYPFFSLLAVVSAVSVSIVAAIVRRRKRADQPHSSDAAKWS